MWENRLIFRKISSKFDVKKKTSPNWDKMRLNPYMELFFALRRNFPCKIFENRPFLGEMSFFLTFPIIFSRFPVYFTFSQLFCHQILD